MDAPSLPDCRTQAVICAALSHARGWFSLDEFAHFMPPERRQPTTLLRCMTELIQGTWIAPRKGEPGCYRPRDKAQRLVAPPALHLQMARYFAQTEAPPLKIAGHLELAGAPSEAVPYWGRAIREAYTADKPQECIAVIERVYAHIANGPEGFQPTDALQLFLEVFEAVPLFRSAPQIDPIVRAVLRICDQAPFSPIVDRAMLYALSSLIWRGHLGEVASLWLRLFRKGKGGRTPEMLRAHRAFLGCLHYLRGAFTRATRIFDALGGYTENLPEDLVLLEYYLLMAHCYALSGRIARAISLVDSVRTHAHLNGRRDVEAWSLGTLAVILVEGGWFAQAQAALTEMETIPEWDVHLVSHSEYYWVKAFLCLAQGRLEEVSAPLKELFHVQDGSTVANFFTPTGIEAAVYLQHMDPETCARYGLAPFARLFGARLARDRTYPAVQGLMTVYEAYQGYRQDGDVDSASTRMRRAEPALARVGAHLAIAKARILQARILSEAGRLKEAVECLRPSRPVIAEMGEGLLSGYLRHHLEPEPPEKLILHAVMSLSHSLGTFRDADMLINKAMETLNHISGAERGAIFLADPHQDRLVLRASQGLTTEQVHSETFRDMYAWLERARVQRTGLIWDGPGEGAFRPKAAICAPLIIRDQVVGVVYQDNRILKDVFTRHDVELIQALATQIAASIENARAYEEIERLNALLAEKTAYYEEESHAVYQEIVIQSEAMQRVASLVEKVAALDTTVLITGETGVGKELIAALIQRLSTRAEQAYIKVDCTTLPEHLIESELFGHEKGAFTGATAARMGRFELADGGTLFLDEVGELPLNLQAKLLRVIQDGEFERLGSTRTRQVDVRILAATNRDLVGEAARLHFRADLFYRLNVFPIHIPPLRERIQDIPSLALFFLGRITKELGKTFDGITRRDINRLKAYEWPGNVRELKHTIERSAILSRPGHFELALPAAEGPVHTRGGTLDDLQKHYITEVLEHTGWKVAGPGGAAAILGLKRTTLLSRMRKLGITRPGKRPLPLD